ncbi:MAG: ABC transporter ATP-binding protein [Oscillospiraceae bacterium]|jgi:putative ABC transport system ATP-binding protein|nr:ABC transporter ATP-binding protein [Oscillospiraceae bacterium]MCI8758015.1 ABC transporter ATP-binding protein [Oscillospiraceae bacterium]MCI9562503.1 ABC transporter ATP-binding protein [Oscillospiraceae bacterium]
METLLELENVTKTYGGGAEAPAVDGVSFRLPRGSFWAVMGPSGCGKSTLLNMISTIDRPTAGRIRLGGQDLARIPDRDMARFRRERLGFIFQDYNLLDTLTLGENIALSMTLQGRPREEIPLQVRELARRLEIEPLLDKFPNQVSGGQRQRCACARALAARPDLLLADEPTGALDSRGAGNLMETLASLNGALHVTVLMVTHDALSASWCEKILFMGDGRITGEMDRAGRERRAFFLDILDHMAAMAGGVGYVS